METSIQIWINISIAVLTFLCSYIIPNIIKSRKNYKHKKETEEKRNATIDAIPQRFDAIEKKQEELEATLSAEIQEVKERQEESDKRFESFRVGDLKYKINDVCNSAANIHEISYESLIIASESCDIYRGMGLNHEIGAKCDLIYEEIERRQRLKAEGKDA